MRNITENKTNTTSCLGIRLLIFNHVRASAKSPPPLPPPHTTDLRLRSRYISFSIAGLFHYTRFPFEGDGPTHVCVSPRTNRGLVRGVLQVMH